MHPTRKRQRTNLAVAVQIKRERVEPQGRERRFPWVGFAAGVRAMLRTNARTDNGTQRTTELVADNPAGESAEDGTNGQPTGVGRIIAIIVAAVFVRIAIVAVFVGVTVATVFVSIAVATVFVSIAVATVFVGVAVAAVFIGVAVVARVQRIIMWWFYIWWSFTARLGWIFWIKMSGSRRRKFIFSWRRFTRYPVIFTIKIITSI